jgi:hypothetical protein
MNDGREGLLEVRYFDIGVGDDPPSWIWRVIRRADNFAVATSGLKCSTRELAQADFNRVRHVFACLQEVYKEQTIVKYGRRSTDASDTGVPTSYVK